MTKGLAATTAVPPRVEYSLTDLGAALNVALLPLGEWGDDHLVEIEATRRR
jgi:DNA-binding HxlR family transcriptional regulator